jgi:DNA-binding Xre family transcriptional regulator
MMLTMTKTNRIAEILEQKDMSIYRLAKDTGLSYQAVHALVNADEIPDGTSYGTLRKISEVLGVQISDLEAGQ